MSWRLAGTYYAPCSCYTVCQCDLGEPEGDRGWCGSPILWDIKSGEIDGVDVSNIRVCQTADFPRGFNSGEGVGRLYFDPSTSPKQRAALESVLTGKAGGLFEVVAALVPKLLPSKEATIRVQQSDDETRYTIGEFAAMVFIPLQDPAGHTSVLRFAPAGLVEDTVLGKGTGTYWRDPDLRQWESGSNGHSEKGDFNLSA